MYLTFYTKEAPHQITFEELLSNPYMTFSELPKSMAKKVTVEATEEYCQRLWDKRKNMAQHICIWNPIIEEMDTAEHYRHFTIPKKSNPNKGRPIDAPDEILGQIQTYYKDYIETKLMALPHKAAHAYVAERSTITAMQTHQKNKSNWYLQIDLKDFFNSINEEWLSTILKKVYPFNYIDSTDFNNIIKASMLNGSLPQGSHLSPTLTNLAMVPIDYEITNRITNYNKHHYVYTRYADDITISCKEKFNYTEILNIIKEVFDSFNVPFKINEEKTRFGSTAGRNYHLGLIVNKDNKISVGHEKNQKFRAQIYNFCLVGEEWDVKDIQKMLGIISYYKSIEPEFVEKVINKYNAKFNINIMEKAKSLIV